MPLFMADARPPSGHWHERVVAGLVTGAAFALPAFSLGLPSGYSWGALMLVLAGFVALLSGGARTCWQLSHWRWFSIAVALMGLVWLLRIDIDWGQPLTIEAFGRIAKYALALIAIAAVCRKPPPIGWLKLGCWTGAWFAGLTAAWQIHVQGMERASGYTNAIQFGDIAVLLTVWSLLWWRHADGVAAKLYAAGAIVAGAYAALASGTRGGWIIAPVLLLLVWLISAPREPSSQKLPISGHSRWSYRASVLMMMLAFASVTWTKREYIIQRFSDAYLEFSHYQKRETSDTSVGTRLALWSQAWTLGHQRPWIGWSETGYKREKQRLTAAGASPSHLNAYGHAHNEWLDLWAKGGIVGVTTLAIFYATPLIIYIRARRTERKPHGRYNAPSVNGTVTACGIVLIIGFIGFGMTQVLFAHNSGNMFYLFMNVLLIGAAAQTKSNKK
jgi:O-antigen ligase